MDNTAVQRRPIMEDDDWEDRCMALVFFLSPEHKQNCICINSS